MANEILDDGRVKIGNARNDLVNAFREHPNGGHFYLPHVDGAGFLIDEPLPIPHNWVGTVEAASNQAVVEYDGPGCDVLALFRGQRVSLLNFRVRKHSTRGVMPRVMLMFTRPPNGNSSGRGLVQNCHIEGGTLANTYSLAAESMTYTASQFTADNTSDQPSYAFMTDTHNREELMGWDGLKIADAGTDDPDIQQKFTNTNINLLGCDFVNHAPLGTCLGVRGGTIGCNSVGGFFSSKTHAFVGFHGYNTSGRRGGIPSNCTINMNYGEGGADYAAIVNSEADSQVGVIGSVVTGLPDNTQYKIGERRWREQSATTDYGIAVDTVFLRTA